MNPLEILMKLLGGDTSAADPQQQQPPQGIQWAKGGAPGEIAQMNPQAMQQDLKRKMMEAYQLQRAGERGLYK